MNRSYDIDKHLPLREATFFILLSLLNGPRHGYAILKDVTHLSGQRVKLSTGTLYGALKRLLEQGWIERGEEAMGADAASKPGPARKTYQLTEMGYRIIEAEGARLEGMLAALQVHTAGQGS